MEFDINYKVLLYMRIWVHGAVTFAEQESSAIVFVLFLQSIYLKWTRNWLMKVREDANS